MNVAVPPQSMPSNSCLPAMPNSNGIELAAVNRVAAVALAPVSEVLSSATATASGRLRSTGRVYAPVR